MAAGDLVPIDQNVARYCRPTAIENDRALGAAFVLEGTHHELSVTWLEKLEPIPDRLLQIRAAATAITRSGFRMKRNGALAVLAVAAIVEDIDCGATLLHLQVLEFPELENPAHCGITNLPQQGSEFSTLVGLVLASRVAEPIYYVRDHL